MPDQQTTPVNNMPKTLQKTRDAILMVQAGIDPESALKYANLKTKVSAKQVSVLRQKVKKYSLQAPSVVKSANNQVKRILAGEVREIPKQAVAKSGEVVDYTEVIAPSDTNILAAASMVYDRYEPAVKIQANVNLDVDPVDLGVYLNSRPIAGPELSSQVHDNTIDIGNSKIEIPPKVPPKDSKGS